MNEDYLANVRPTARQISWQRMEMYGFIHFGMNTMTDREWGLGHEDPKIFNPNNLDVDQWLDALQSAGMTGVILTCKHHDGFCLWPSKYTKHTIASSPYKNGKGDIVREVSESAYRHNMKFGVYLSPWDRTESSYGTGKVYNDFYINQLVELLTHYGPIFSVWLDGACGEGENGKTQTYDWQRIYNTVRALQPDAVISVCGPDVRWCGNEAGHTRSNEWSVLPTELRSAELTSSKSQQSDDGKFSRKFASTDEDLGSRKALAHYEGDFAWYPAEVDTSIRKGWFHHDNEDNNVRSSDELFDIWCKSVGGNSTLLLNVPPTRHGLLADSDVKILKELGDKIRKFHGRELRDYEALSIQVLSPNAYEGNPKYLVDRKQGTELSSSKPIDFRMVFTEPTYIDGLVIEEDISKGQHVETAEIHVIDEYGVNHHVSDVHAIGYRKILRFDAIRAVSLTVRITSIRQYVALQSCYPLVAQDE